MGSSPPQSVPAFEADAFGPGFFLSCARTPSLPGDGADPDYWPKKFFHDLNAEVRLWDGGLVQGFFAGHVPPGEDPYAHTARNLANCRIFVPLYEDEYFENDQCGREWAVFEQRRELRRARTGDDGRSIVPVLWMRQENGDWPSCALSMRPDHVIATDLYLRLGLYELIRLHERAYHEVVKQLAWQIALRARSEAPPVAAEGALPRAEPRFPEAGRTSRRLFITVVAGTRETIPKDRDPEYYGERPEDWRPYQPQEPEPLARRAARIAHSLGYQPEIHSLTSTSPEAKVSHRLRQDPQFLQPPAASILLADPWQFQGYRERRNLETVDQRRKEWVRLMVPWCATDAETVEQRTSLEAHMGDAVPWMSQGWRRTRAEELADLASAAEFDEALPAEIDRARSRFLSNSHPLRDSMPAHYAARPRLAPPPDDERMRDRPG